MSDSNLLTYRQAAQVLGLRISTLYSMVSRREIPHVRLGRRIVRFAPDELRAWLDVKRVGELPSRTVVQFVEPIADSEE